MCLTTSQPFRSARGRKNPFSLVTFQNLFIDDIQSAMLRLNSSLLDISQLYQNYAEPFDLWECQLAILHCSGHHDPHLVETMWSNIIDAELKKSEEFNYNSRIVMLSNKMKELGKIYAFSQKYFPMGKYIKMC